MRRILIASFLALVLPAGGAMAQDQQETLADIRQQLTMLHVQMQSLTRELSTTGATGTVSAGQAPIERLNAIEGELRRLTGKTEELEQRIDRIVADGTVRIGDLEYRLVTLEGGDPSKLGETTTLGGGAAAADPSGTDGSARSSGTESTAADTRPQSAQQSSAQSSSQAPSQDLAMGERADYEAAQALLAQGDYAAARQGFQDFLANYPGSPLLAGAELGRARALEGQGEINDAAAAYLQTFTLAPKGDTAPEALFRMGTLLQQLGETVASCRTLAAVTDRFPGSSYSSQALSLAGSQGCS